MSFCIGMEFEFAEVSFRVRYGPPQVRSLRTISVSLYRRTPHGAVTITGNEGVPTGLRLYNKGG